MLRRLRRRRKRRWSRRALGAPWTTNLHLMWHQVLRRRARSHLLTTRRTPPPRLTRLRAQFFHIHQQLHQQHPPPTTKH